MTSGRRLRMRTPRAAVFYIEGVSTMFIVIMLFLAGFVLWPIWAVMIGIAVSGNKPGIAQIIVIALLIFVLVRSCSYA